MPPRANAADLEREALRAPEPEAFAALPEQERRLVRLYYGLDTSELLLVAEVAQQVGLTPAQVRRRLVRAVPHLLGQPRVGARSLSWRPARHPAEKLIKAALKQPDDSYQDDDDNRQNDPHDCQHTARHAPGRSQSISAQSVMPSSGAFANQAGRNQVPPARRHAQPAGYRLPGQHRATAPAEHIPVGLHSGPNSTAAERASRRVLLAAAPVSSGGERASLWRA